MAVALGLAVVLPMELFLLAYAVLGPLHYLTEINWLNNNDFHLKQKSLIWIPVFVTIAVSLPALLRSLLPATSYQSIRPVLQALQIAYPFAIIFCLVLAAGMVLKYHRLWWATVTVVVGVVFWLFRDFYPYQLLGALLLPTVVHVYLFTLAFMVYGLTKAPNRAGTAEVIALLMIPVVIALLPLDIAGYIPSDSTRATFLQSGFGPVITSLGRILRQPGWPDVNTFLSSEAGIRIQIFIAFAYTYHYLNWFSKVSLIGWLRNASTGRIAALTSVWLFSVSMYAIDYRLGLGILFTLSLLHVTLEFPLNIISVRGIIRFACKPWYTNNK